MSKARFLLHRIGGSNVSGKSEATRYIARNDLDHEREGRTPRPLFSDHEDALTHWEADRWLSVKKDGPAKEDIMHYVLSFQLPEDHERLGETDKERNTEVREAVRTAMRRAETEMRVVRLHWVAGIHLNEDNPHVHIIISKAAVDRDTEKLRRIGKLPRQITPHNDRLPDGEREFIQGAMLTTFAAHVDARQREHERHLERALSLKKERHEQSGRDAPAALSQTNDPVWRTRFLLGQSMIARGEMERLGMEIESLKRHGDKRRFKVYDASYDRHRRVSEFDVERRADLRATRYAIEFRNLSPAERHQRHEEFYAQEIAKHSKTIASHQEIKDKALAKLERKLEEASEHHAGLQPAVQSIIEQHDREGKPLPVPLLSRGQLKKLHDGAIEARDAARTGTLEKIRLSLAAERGEPARTEREWARLSAQLREAQIDLQTRHKRSEHFERTRHLRQFEIGGERWSLARVDRQLERVQKQTSFVHVGISAKFPSVKQQAAEQVAGLQEIRAKVTEQIAQARVEHEAGRSRVAGIVEVLADFYQREEKGRQRARNERMPEALFTRAQLQHIEDHAHSLKDAALLLEFHRLEQDYEARLPAEKRRSDEQLAARALARETVARADMEASKENFARMEERSLATPVVLRNANGEDFTATPDRRRLRSLGSLIIHAAESPHRPAPSTLERAVAEQAAGFIRAVKETQSYYETARAIADTYRDHILREGRGIPAPEFTPKELNALDLHRMRLEDPQARLYYENLIEAAEVKEYGLTSAPEAPELGDQTPNLTEPAPERRRAASPGESHTSPTLTR